jgi:hypothetical protein
MTFALLVEDSLKLRENYVAAELASGDTLGDVLSRDLRAVEAAADVEMLTSILLLNGTRLWHGAAPSLPPSYCSPIDGAEIGPRAGSCGTAAFFGRPVYVTDIDTDPLWADYREHALGHGLRACWSTPIFDDQAAVIGTFAIYHLTPRAPTLEEVKAIQMITGHVARAIVWSNRSSNDLGNGVHKVSPRPVLRLVTTAEASIQRELLLNIARHFDSLARAIDFGIDFFAEHEPDCPEIRSLHRAKQATQKGAALARTALTSPETDLASPNPYLS